MNTKILLAFILSAILLCGCSSDLAPEKEEQPTVKLSKYGVAKFAGGSDLIDVISAGEFSLLEENPEIATAWWTNDGKTIRVETHGVGETGIVITNTATAETVRIKVFASYFSGDLTDRELGDTGLPKVVTLVQTQDAEITQIIDADLRARTQQDGINEYVFNSDDKKLEIFSDSGQRKYVGTYEWSIDSLTMNYNGISDRYGFAYDNGEVYLQKDFTEEYKALYPDAHVIRATVQKILRTYRPFL